MGGQDGWDGGRRGGGGHRRHLAAEGQEGGAQEEKHQRSEGPQIHSKVLQAPNLLLPLQGLYMVSGQLADNNPTICICQTVGFPKI